MPTANLGEDNIMYMFITFTVLAFVNDINDSRLCSMYVKVASDNFRNKRIYDYNLLNDILDYNVNT